MPMIRRRHALLPFTNGRSTMIAWYSHEIDDWIRSRPRRQFGQHEFRGARAGDALDAPETTHKAIRDV